MSKFRQRCPVCTAETVSVHISGVPYDVCPRCKVDVGSVGTAPRGRAFRDDEDQLSFAFNEDSKNDQT